MVRFVVKELAELNVQRTKTFVPVPAGKSAKPVPVNVSRLARGRSDYVLVAAAGPASNILIAIVASIGLDLLPVSPQRVGESNISAPIAALLAQAMPMNVPSRGRSRVRHFS